MTDLFANILPVLTDNTPNWLVSFLFQLIGGFIRTILQPVVAAIYMIGVWAPLQIINGLVIVFKYFANGFTYAIFSNGEVNPDGSTFYDFQWTSALGSMIILVFVIALIYFFINFLLTFTQNSVVDETGKPTMMQSKRFYYLKWPLFMLLLLVGMPFIMITVDTFMTQILSIFYADQSVRLNSATVSVFSTQIFSRSLTDNSLYAIIYRYNTTDAAIDNKPLSVFFQDLIAQFDTLNNLAASNGLTDISTLLGDASREASDIYNYTNSVGEYNEIFLFLTELKIDPGEYISNSDAMRLINMSGRMQSVIDELISFDNIYEKMTHVSKYRVEYDMLTELDPDTMAELKNSLEIYSGEMNYTGSVLSTAYVGENSLAHQLCVGTENVPGLLILSRYTQMANSDSNICYILYTYSTGDPNGDNWRYSPDKLLWSSKRTYMNLVSFALSILSCMATILILYQFTRSAVQRSFYILLCYVIGWLYLANGIKEARTATAWYQQIFGRWISIIVMYAFFELSLALFTIFEPLVASGLANFSVYEFGGIKYRFAADFGVLMTLEATLTIAYTVSQTVTDDLWKTKDEKWTAAKSMLLTEGKSLKNNLWESGKGYASFAVDRATFKASRDGLKYIIESKQYWRDREDTRAMRGLRHDMNDKRNADFHTEQLHANALGYHLDRKRTGGSKFLGTPETFTFSVRQMNEAERIATREKYGTRLLTPGKRENEQYKLDNEQAKNFNTNREDAVDQRFSAFDMARWGENSNRPANLQHDGDGRMTWVEDPKVRSEPGHVYLEKHRLETYLRTHGKDSENYDRDTYIQAVHELEAVNKYAKCRLHNDDYSNSDMMRMDFINPRWKRTYFSNLETDRVFMKNNPDAFPDYKNDD